MSQRAPLKDQSDPKGEVLGTRGGPAESVGIEGGICYNENLWNCTLC